MALQVHEVVAFNYAEESANKIHSDEVAAKFGFKGGLVPGTADFAYLCQAVYKLWGDEWLHGGSMEAKFIKPIYHGEVARAEARPTDDPDRVELALVDPRGVVCSVGQAQRVGDQPVPSVDDYPHQPQVPAGELPEPSVSAFPAGRALGSLDLVESAQRSVQEAKDMFVEALVGADGATRWHPALATHLGNEILKENVRLDSWIHTASRVRYLAPPADGEAVSLRGSVADTYEKRGHVMTECDLALFGEGDRPLLALHHTAIIRLAGA